MWGYNLFYDGTQITNRDEDDCEFETEDECYEDAEYEIDQTIKYWESEGSWRPEEGDSRANFYVDAFECGEVYDEEWDADIESSQKIEADGEQTMDELNDMASFSDWGSRSVQSALRSLLSSINDAINEARTVSHDFADDLEMNKVDMNRVKSYLVAAHNRLVEYVESYLFAAHNILAKYVESMEDEE